jgi:hypothetical protein
MRVRSTVDAAVDPVSLQIEPRFHLTDKETPPLSFTLRQFD